MKYRPFGSAGFSCSEVGLGTWQLGADWGNVSEQDALAILAAAVDQGVNFLDTADVYGLGRSETLVGKFLKQRSEALFVATKLGRFPEPGWPDNFTAETIRAHTEASLRRLGVEALDLTQLHCIPIEEYRRGDVFEVLRTLKTQGKIKAFGASVESVEEGFVCLEQDGLASLQVIFNIFRQKPAEELFQAAQAKNVAIIARVPLASGLLSGKMTKDTAFGEDDHRNYNRDGAAFNVGETFAGLPFEKGVEVADAMRVLVPEDMRMADMALRWILDHDAVSVVIPGATRIAQAVDNAAASDMLALPEVLHAKLRAFYDAQVAPHIRGPY